jgi:flagellar basal body rod protein FlgG
MGSFDQGISGMVSLRAVNEWIGVLNSNLGGSNRTAYKSTKISFGGGVAQVLRDPRVEANGLQIPDSTLTVSSTRIDFNQGTIIQDGELTHMAISGDGFFAVTDGTNVFYTRDGDFRWSERVVDSNSNTTETILTTANGLAVLATGGQPAFTNGAVGDLIIFSSGHGAVGGEQIMFTNTGGATGLSTNVIYYVVAPPTNFNSFQISATPGGPAINFGGGFSGGAIVGLATSARGVIVADDASTLNFMHVIERIGSGATFSVTTSTVTGGCSPPSVYRFPNNQALKFSKYGSTVFDASNAVDPSGFLGFPVIPSSVTDVEIFQSALESSNAALNDTLPELSLAQKLFSAVSKIINVHNSDLDLVINLIR